MKQDNTNNSSYYISCVGELCLTLKSEKGFPPKLYKITGVTDLYVAIVFERVEVS